MIGRSVGRYRIIAKLGEGGMGSVWKAEDPLLGRSIALKFLPESLAASPGARRRFLREARAASTLDHPGIATVYDAGEADGLVYIAMLLVDGATASDLAARGPLPPAEAVRIAVAAAEALGLAHARGILHRDVTGRNIMVAHDGRVVVVDFGLVTGAYSLFEKHEDHHLKRTTVGLEVGDFVTQWLSLRLFGAWQHSVGGIDWFTADFSDPDTGMAHDSVANASFYSAGGGVTFTLNSAVDITIGYTGILQGQNTHDARGFIFGTSWTFGGGPQKLAASRRPLTSNLTQLASLR